MIKYTETKNAEDGLKYRLVFENVIATIATHFINLSLSKIDDGINRALETICRFAHMDRSYVFLFYDGCTKMSCTHEWCADGIEPQIRYLQDIMVARDFPWFLEEIKNNETIYIPCVADMPQEAKAEREEFERENIQSLIDVPMISGDSLLGFVGFETVVEEMTWNEDFIALLKTVGAIFLNALERKWAEEALIDSESRYRTLVENANDYIYTTNPEGKFTFLNKQVETLLGISREDWYGKPFFSILHPDDLDVVLEARTKILDGKPQHLIVRIVNRKKEIKYLSINSVPLFEKSQITGTMGFARDITGCKKAEETLRKSEQKYRRLFEQSAAIILIIGTDLCVKDVNKALLKELGYSKDEIIGRNTLDFIIPEQKNNISERFGKSIKDGFSEEAEVDVYAKDGSIHTILFPASVPVFLHEGELVTGILITGIDITKRKHALEKAKKQEEQLIQASKMVSLGTLVSGVAHEINNPNHFIFLNSKIFSRIWDDIASALEKYADKHEDFTLAGMPFSEARKKLPALLSGISDGSNRIQKIVKSLKDFARHDRGMLDQNVDINSIVESSVVIVSNLTKKSTNKFFVEYGKNLPAITGNVQQIGQVIINLITNACQALREREEAIAVTTQYEPDSDEVIVKVCDEGIGISPENMKHIMDPFFTTKRDFEGTGLGLSISYNIIRNHNGELSIRSKPGKGTTATVRLPVLMEK